MENPMPRTTATMDDGVTLRATRARQGGKGLQILVVLVISTVLAAAAMFIALAVISPDGGPSGPGERQMTPEAAGVPAPSGGDVQVDRPLGLPVQGGEDGL